MKKQLLFFLLAFPAIVFSQSYFSVVNEDIPDDGSSIEFELNVSGLPATIDSLFGLESVCINLNHTWDSDLDIRLVAPDGSSFILISGIGWGAVNFTNTCLNENSVNNLADGTGPYTGEWKPIGDMGVVNNGQDPNGIWKLLILDTWAFADAGFMISWIISFGDEPALAFPFYSSNLPIVKINTGGHVIQNEPKASAEIAIIDHGAGIFNHPTDTDYFYQGNILVELQGFSGPGYPKKNYDFDLMNDAGLEIDTVLLNLPSENDYILKAEYLDYSLIKNTLTYELSREMGRYAPRTRFCELMLDGEYLGLYTLTEKVKRDKNRVDIANLDSLDITGDELTGGYIIEINENFTPNDWESNYLPINDATCDFPVAFKMVDPKIEFTKPEQLNYIHAYVDSFEDALYGDDFLDSINGYRKYISVKSFIDFMLVNEFSANYDSYGRSTFLFKDKNGQLNIGPPWDYDRAYAPWTVEGWVWEITHPYWPFPFWWSRFRDDEEWRNEVYCRYTDLRSDILSDENFHAIIDSSYNLIRDAAIRNFQKWTELGVTDYDYFYNELRNFTDDRLAWMDDEIDLDYVAPPDGGFIFTIVTPSTFSFYPNETNANYFWEFGDGGTSSLENPVYTYATPGEYPVYLTVDKFYGCRASSDQVVSPTLAILNADKSQPLVYPNPVHDQLQIWMPGKNQPTEISVSNMTGEIVAQSFFSGQPLISIDIADLPAGNYMVEIKSENSNFSTPIIKY